MKEHKHQFQLYDGLYVCKICGQIKDPKEYIQEDFKKQLEEIKKSPQIVSKIESIPSAPGKVYSYDRSTITIDKGEKEEWSKLKKKGKHSWTGLLSHIRIEYLKVERLKEELKNANATLRDIALRQASQSTIINMATPLGAPIPLPPPPAPNKLPAPNFNIEAKINDPNRLAIIKAIKEEFKKCVDNNGFIDVTKLLKKVSDEDITAVQSRQVHAAILAGTYKPA